MEWADASRTQATNTTSTRGQVSNSCDADPVIGAIIIDGASLVNALCSITGSIFELYAADDFLPNVPKYIKKTQGSTHPV